MRRSKVSRALRFSALGGIAAAILLLAPMQAEAAIPSVYGGDASCAAQPASGNIRLCAGETVTWDGKTQIDVNVILPPEPGSGSDGPYPTIGDFHGWGGSKIGINAQTQRWAEDGYVVFSMSDRGWGKSCGKEDLADLLTEACAAGYIHLMDNRVEVRDAQFLLSMLADEGIAQPQRIGATGFSYGGGISMALAALRDRTMLPDGSLAPWKSPAGTQMSLAAAVPQWPWTDLAYSLMPNGRTLDYVVDAPYRGPNGTAPIGVEKASFVTALYGLGAGTGTYALPGADASADLTTWYLTINGGEPYDSNPLATSIVDEILTHHSSYYIDHSQSPAPLLIQSGWNDDLFPVDEAIRFYNRTRDQYPGDPISLYLSDDGHMRSQNKPADAAAFEARQDAWFDYFLKDEGPKPSSSAEALTTKCGGASEGPYAAPSWRELAPGEIRFESATAQTIVPGGGDPAVGTAFDPIAGSGACATAGGADQPGVANYRLPSVPSEGFTLIGSPTVIADISSPNPDSALAARLVDVSPGGTETLVARGLLRPGNGGSRFVFQLHPQSYRFIGGQVVKLELLPSDAPYSRPSNLQGTVTVSNLELRLPVLEKPGSLGGQVKEPAPPVVPPGYRLVSGYPKESSTSVKAAAGVIGLAKGKIRAGRKAIRLRLRCSGQSACAGSLKFTVAGRRAGARRALARGTYSLAANSTGRQVLRLTRGGRKLVAARFVRLSQGSTKRRSFRARLDFADAGRPGTFHLTRPVHLRQPRKGK